MNSRTLPISEIVTLFYLTALILAMSLVGCSTVPETEPQPVALQVQAPRPVSPPPAPPPVAEEPVIQAPVTYADAEAAYNERDFERALALFIRYTDEHQANPWGHYMLGLSAWKSGDLETAELAFRESLFLSPEHLKSWQNLSRVYLDAGRTDDAHSALDEASGIEPASNITFRLRGRAFHQGGDLQSAADAYRDAIILDETDAWSMNNLALVLMEEARFELALPALARTTQLRPDIAIFRNNLGMALEHQGRIRAAESAYSEAVNLDELHASAAANLERVAAVDQAIGNETDLADLADAFVREVASWTDEEIAREETPTDDRLSIAESLADAPKADALVSRADSTASNN